LNIQNGECLHIVLFGTFNENKYFLGDYKDKFDLIGFNANIVAHAPAGMAAFISQLKNKSYFIDPQIYAFQQPIKTIMRKREDGSWGLKRSIEKLAGEYGSIIKEKVGIETIQAQELDKNLIKEVCKNVLKFEYNKIKQAAENLDVKPFLDFSGEELRPEFLIAPYFYLDPDNLEKQLEINMNFLDVSNNLVNDKSSDYEGKLFAEIVIDKDVLVIPEKKDLVVERYKSCNSDGFIIWIDDFLEVDDKLDTLDKYKAFLKELATCEKPILQLHGSYLSVILAGKELKLLAGVGHGIEYGEYRPIVPVGGGVPLAKFYFPKFYKRVNYHPDSSNILIEMNWTSSKYKYFEELCSCNMCQEIIADDVIDSFQKYGETKLGKDGRRNPTAEAMDMSRRHYLNNKIDEYIFCRENSIQTIIKQLKQGHSIAEKLKKIHSFDHLNRWIKVLEKMSEKST